MGEVGCLKDGIFQNLQVEGDFRTGIALFSGALSTIKGADLKKTATSTAGPSQIVIGKEGNFGGDVNPFALDGTTAQYPLGTTLYYGNRVFKYANIEGQPAAGTCLQTLEAVATHRDLTTAVNAAGSRSYTVTLGSDAVTENLYAEGFVHVNDVDGQGQLLQIASHDSAAGNAALVLTLYDAVVVATTVNSKTDLIANPYQDLVAAPTTFTGAIVGISPMLGVDENFGWVQVSGIASVLYNVNGAGATLELGGKVIRSDETAGAVMGSTVAASADEAHQSIGTVMVVNGTGDNIVILMEPTGF